MFRLFKSKSQKMLEIYSPWNSVEFNTLLNNANNRLSPERGYVLREFAQSCLHAKGDWAEFGVYRGATAFLLADLLCKKTQVRSYTYLLLLPEHLNLQIKIV